MNDTITLVAGAIDFEWLEVTPEVIEAAIAEFATLLETRPAPLRVDYSYLVGVVDSISYDAPTNTARWTGKIVEPWPAGPLDDEGRVILDASIGGRWAPPYPQRERFIIQHLFVSRPANKVPT